MKKKCIECKERLDNDVFAYSLENLGAPLCRKHQAWLTNSAATKEERALYLALRLHGVRAELQKFDGHKTIDIVVKKAKIHIEVDGTQHHSATQALADLKRTYYSFRNGYLTIRIPNALVQYNFDETVDLLVELLIESEDQLDDDY